MADVLTAIALVASGECLRLPGVTYRPLDCAHLRDIELSCIHRRGDAAPVLAALLAAFLAAFLAVVRGTV